MKKLCHSFIVFAAMVLLVFAYPTLSKKDSQANAVSPEETPLQPTIAQTPTENTGTTIPIAGPDAAKYEMRAAWLATVSNINMPAGMSEVDFTTWANTTLDQLKNYGFNTVIFQVKPAADALYPSQYAPFSSTVTGLKQGTDPGYDPLQIMVELSHQKGLEIHAWMNPYRVTTAGQTLNDLADTNIAKINPGWIFKYGQQYYLNPGIPEVRSYLVNCVIELVENYDIDAIHMDDYFYPYKIAGEDIPDQAGYAAYGAEFQRIEDWRRSNVTSLVQDINNAIKARKYWVQFGVSPFGVWRNIATDPTGSNTRAGVECYDTLYADTRAWIQNGSIDYIAPQIYWTREFQAANYVTLAHWWAEEVATKADAHPVHLYVGLADYKIGTTPSTDPTWQNKEEIAGQIALNRSLDPIQGQMHFAVKQILENALDYMAYTHNEAYALKAITPATPWNNAEIPPAPAAVSIAEENGIRQIKITAGSSDTITGKYAIYRFGLEESPVMDQQHLLDIVYRSDNTIYTEQGAPGNYIYYVTSLSHTNVESSFATLAE